MPKDWYEWHDLYDTEPKLQQRLEIVQEWVRRDWITDAIATPPVQTTQTIPTVSKL
ncbi:hypothetical protein [Nostoc sphaeroides]|uniref:SAM-dependent methyltransferase n=1 Tax=Nostoc sphaeroides CCNUC1 TaxID=2653204 RepID=A0A5P8WBE1_9NOSO|nr:hypothetical protein [Nostoc sphaeroides]MCC5632038.1 hypothetical protein [Nostoc sphaeroides CHAB 2801]QFS49934.1 SAM-dependent methyltransferase [Nostoc sphaeroides CCNUC1]